MIRDFDAAMPTAAAPLGRPPVQVHLINLDRSTDRLQSFNRINAHLPDIIRVPAVDGAALDTSVLMASGLIEDGLRYAPGAMGCALSHIGLWRHAVACQTPLTIAEDDAICSHDVIAHMATLSAMLPEDWDYVAWGYGFHNYIWIEALPGISPTELRLTETGFHARAGGYQGGTLRPTLFPLLHMFSTIFYSVSPRGAQRLLDACLPLKPEHIGFTNFGIVIDNLGIDCKMCQVWPSMSAHVALPPIAISLNDNSLIR